MYTTLFPLALLSPLASCFLLFPFCPICPLLLTWNPPCCDRICPPYPQVARKLTLPFPSPGSYTPHSKIPIPRSFPTPNICTCTFIRTTMRTQLTRSSTVLHLTTPPPPSQPYCHTIYPRRGGGRGGMGGGLSIWHW